MHSGGGCGVAHIHQEEVFLSGYYCINGCVLKQNLPEDIIKSIHVGCILETQFYSFLCVYMAHGCRGSNTSTTLLIEKYNRLLSTFKASCSAGLWFSGSPIKWTKPLTEFK